MSKGNVIAVAAAAAMSLSAGAVLAKTVQVTMHAKETTVKIDNKGTDFVHTARTAPSVDEGMRLS